jgi:hypothetical protein
VHLIKDPEIGMLCHQPVQSVADLLELSAKRFTSMTGHKDPPAIRFIQKSPYKRL